VGLALLRAAIGLALAVQGTSSVLEWRGFGFWALAIDLAMIAGGALLLIGYMTPIAGALAALLSLANAFAWVPAPIFDLFQDKMTAVLAAIVALAIICLGPGALSLDARLFGRREIVVPARPLPRT